jgi:hypothetical protein
MACGKTAGSTNFEHKEYKEIKAETREKSIYELVTIGYKITSRRKTMLARR